MLIVSSSFRSEKGPPLECFQEGHSLSDLFFGLANRHCPFLLLPASPAFCLLSIPAARHPPLHFAVVKSAEGTCCGHFPLCATAEPQPDFTAFNHHCSESRKSQKSFTRHIASYLVAREGSIDWRQVGFGFTD